MIQRLITDHEESTFVSLHTSLRDRLRPWHALLLAVFLVGAGRSIATSNIGAAGIAAPDALLPVVEGLLYVVVFQFTVGNVWGYAVEYRNAGGRWRDPPFLAPFVVTAVAAIATFVVTRDPWAAAGIAFWTFVLCAAMLAVAMHVLAGYRAAGEQPSVE